MPISGLRVRFTDDGDAMDRGIAALEGDRRIDIGARRDDKLAIVLETQDADEDKAAWKWINALPEVRHVDVVFISLDQDDQTPSAAIGAEGVKP